MQYHNWIVKCFHTLNSSSYKKKVEKCVRFSNRIITLNVEMATLRLYIYYTNDLPKILNKHNSMVLYADDTSIIITDTNKLNFEINLKQTFRYINVWFNANLLTLNFQKTQYLEFRCMNYCNS
jgi:hypothetical protein